MKKIIVSVFSLLIAFVVAGCSCNIKPFYMDDNLYNNTSSDVFIDLNTYSEYEELISNKKSFALYVYEPTCGGCIKFSPVLTNYLKEKNLSFYRINVGIAKSADNDISKNMKGTPAVFLFDQGKYITFLDSHSEKELHVKAFESKDGFNTWFTKYVILK